MKLPSLLLLLSVTTFAQSPDAIRYAPRQILLVDPTPGTEAIVPMTFMVDGKPQLRFVPVHDVKTSLENGGRPIALADILSALGEATEKINQLQAENERLWKIAMKDAPKSETVIVQQPSPAPAAPSQAQIASQQQAEATARRQQALQMWMQLQNANRQQNINVRVSDCTRLPALCVGK